MGASPAATDGFIGNGNLDWSGSAVSAIADAATSGQIGQFLPMRLHRGQMILNFPIHLVSSADYVTDFTSGVVSGQISRDGASFGALQSGAFTEIGLGYYNLQALTSGDLLANTVALRFSAAGISGGSALPRSYSIILQRTSGQ